MCACCGGWFIKINDNIYRFYKLPKNSEVDLKTATMPINVELDWNLRDSGCIGDEIIIDRIKIAD